MEQYLIDKLKEVLDNAMKKEVKQYQWVMAKEEFDKYIKPKIQKYVNTSK